MAVGRRSSWLLAIFIVFGVLVLQAACWLVSLAVSYKMVEKSGQVHKGMTVAQVEQVLGQPMPNSTVPGLTAGTEQRTYKESLGTQVLVFYQNGVADSTMDNPGIDLWSPNIAVIGFNLWCLLTAIPLIAYRALASPRGEFRYRQLFAMPRFSMSRMFMSMTAIVLAVCVFVLLDTYRIADWPFGLPLALIGAGLMGSALGGFFNRPGFGVLVGLWTLVSLPYLGLVAYAMHPAIG
jgi:hypothetical protein